MTIMIQQQQQVINDNINRSSTHDLLLLLINCNDQVTEFPSLSLSLSFSFCIFYVPAWWERFWPLRRLAGPFVSDRGRGPAFLRDARRPPGRRPWWHRDPSPPFRFAGRFRSICHWPAQRAITNGNGNGNGNGANDQPICMVSIIPFESRSGLPLKAVGRAVRHPETNESAGTDSRRWRRRSQRKRQDS